MTFYKKFTKPLLDYFLSLFFLILCSPLFCIISLAVLVFDGGPILYKQKRVGQFGRSFMIFKFKTMKNSSGPLLTFENDTRITGLGKFLRKYKLDEIPQLLNILKGEMSFIGPRPEVPILALKRYQINKLLFQFKPGITGLSSIEFINESKRFPTDPQNAYKAYFDIILPQKIKIDEEYARRSSFLLDMIIILKTIKRLLFF